VFEKLANFLNDEIDSINPTAGLLYDRSMMAEKFSKFPHEMDRLPIRDYWIEQEISEAKNKKAEFKQNMEDAWNL
jgi:hypothetical protein